MSETDPAREWQRLTELYLAKYDDELLALADDLDELTPVAQQVLQAELQRRGLKVSSPAAAEEERSSDQRSQFDLPDPSSVYFAQKDRAGGIFLPKAEFKKPVAGEYLDWIPDEAQDDEKQAVHYIPKVLLREFAAAEEARAAKYLLSKAGIESWVEVAERQGFDLRAPRLFVAADQMEEAKAALPDILPGDLVLEMGQEVEDFMVPPCPSCGAVDSLLESSPEAEQGNHWYCESCGHRWEEKLSSSY